MSVNPTAVDVVITFTLLFANCEGLGVNELEETGLIDWSCQNFPVDPKKGLSAQFYLSKYLSKDFSDTGPKTWNLASTFHNHLTGDFISRRIRNG